MCRSHPRTDAIGAAVAAHSASALAAQSVALDSTSPSLMSSPEELGGDVSYEDWKGEEHGEPAQKRRCAHESPPDKNNVSNSLLELIGSKEPYACPRRPFANQRSLLTTECSPSQVQLLEGLAVDYNRAVNDGESQSKIYAILTAYHNQYYINYGCEPAENYGGAPQGFPSFSAGGVVANISDSLSAKWEPLKEAQSTELSTKLSSEVEKSWGEPSPTSSPTPSDQQLYQTQSECIDETCSP